MFFDFCNASVIFQFYINDILCEFLDEFCVIYLNNILIYIDDIYEKYIQHIYQILQYLLDHDFYIKFEKCKFHVRETKFLNFIISPDNIAMNPEYIASIID